MATASNGHVAIAPDVQSTGSTTPSVTALAGILPSSASALGAALAMSFRRYKSLPDSAPIAHRIGHALGHVFGVHTVAKLFRDAHTKGTHMIAMSKAVKHISNNDPRAALRGLLTHAASIPGVNEHVKQAVHALAPAVDGSLTSQSLVHSVAHSAIQHMLPGDIRGDVKHPINQLLADPKTAIINGLPFDDTAKATLHAMTPENFNQVMTSRGRDTWQDHTIKALAQHPSMAHITPLVNALPLPSDDMKTTVSKAHTMLKAADIHMHPAITHLMNVASAHTNSTTTFSAHELSPALHHLADSVAPTSTVAGHILHATATALDSPNQLESMKYVIKDQASGGIKNFARGLVDMKPIPNYTPKVTQPTPMDTSPKSASTASPTPTTAPATSTTAPPVTVPTASSDQTAPSTATPVQTSTIEPAVEE